MASSVDSHEPHFSVFPLGDVTRCLLRHGIGGPLLAGNFIPQPPDPILSANSGTDGIVVTRVNQDVKAVPPVNKVVVDGRGAVGVVLVFDRVAAFHPLHIAVHMQGLLDTGLVQVSHSVVILTRLYHELVCILIHKCDRLKDSISSILHSMHITITITIIDPHIQ
jgi:hypothetical protein